MTRGAFPLPAALALLACLWAPRPLAALASGADFLSAQIPARPAAMAGAYGAYDDDAVAFLWNPGALGKVPEPMLSATHFLSIVDTEFDQASYVQPLRVWNSNGGLGMDIQYDTTTNFDQIDAQGNNLGAVENYDLLVAGGGGLALSDALRLGVTAKLFSSRLAEYKAQGFAVDLGAQSDITGRLTLGMALLNMGTQSAYDEVADPLPTDYSLAARYLLVDSSLVRIQTAAQLDRPWSTDGPVTLGVGAEYWYARSLVFRAGYKFGVDVGPLSMGAGFKWQGLSLDYAYNTLGDLGMTNRFSMTVELGTLFKKLGWTVEPIQGLRPREEPGPLHVSAP